MEKTVVKRTILIHQFQNLYTETPFLFRQLKKSRIFINWGALSGQLLIHRFQGFPLGMQIDYPLRWTLRQR